MTYKLFYVQIKFKTRTYVCTHDSFWHALHCKHIAIADSLIAYSNIYARITLRTNTLNIFRRKKYFSKSNKNVVDLVNCTRRDKKEMLIPNGRISHTFKDIDFFRWQTMRYFKNFLTKKIFFEIWHKCDGSELYTMRQEQNVNTVKPYLSYL